MNFLAHFVIATRFSSSAYSLPAYVVGNVLPDLLPLAADRIRLRPALVERQLAGTDEEAALRAGVLVHLATDAVFHKTHAFAEAQATVTTLLEQTAFDDIRVRRFFLAHVLVELALDAVLLRRDPSIAKGFYEAFAAADYAEITRWTETAVRQPLPELPDVLTRFGQSRYLYHYQEDEGVATGLSRLCARARQDTFEGRNYQKLVELVRRTVTALGERAETLLRESAEAIAEGEPIPPHTPNKT